MYEAAQIICGPGKEWSSRVKRNINVVHTVRIDSSDHIRRILGVGSRGNGKIEKQRGSMQTNIWRILRGSGGQRFTKP
jgi:hypothetical protein